MRPAATRAGERWICKGEGFHTDKEGPRISTKAGYWLMEKVNETPEDLSS